MSNYPEGVSDNDIDRVMEEHKTPRTLIELEAALADLQSAVICLSVAERHTNNTQALEAVSDSINWIEGYAIPYCEVAISELGG